MPASSRPRWAAAEVSASERLRRTTMGADDSASKAETATDPEDSRKPDSPAEITRPAWKFVIRRTIHEFSWDQCTTLAAALTYYGVLSLFPGLLALVSVLGLFGQAEATTAAIVEILRGVADPAVVEAVRGPIEELEIGRAHV